MRGVLRTYLGEVESVDRLANLADDRRCGRVYGGGRHRAARGIKL